jgi:hypothetical protein
MTTQVSDAEAKPMTAQASTINLSVVIPIITAIVAGLIALLTNIYATYLNGQNQLVLEKQRFRANLIVESVKTGDRGKAIENLKFFMDAGFLDDPDGRLTTLITSNRSPVLPTDFEELRKTMDENNKKAKEIIDSIRR